MSERNLARNVSKWLQALDPVRVENLVGPGTPDINYSDGWLELKWFERWSVRGNTITLRHFTPQQRAWLRQRWHSGGNAYLLIQVGPENFYLLDGCSASSLPKVVSRPELDRASLQRYSLRRPVGLVPLLAKGRGSRAICERCARGY